MECESGKDGKSGNEEEGKEKKHVGLGAKGKRVWRTALIRGKPHDEGKTADKSCYEVGGEVGGVEGSEGENREKWGSFCLLFFVCFKIILENCGLRG